MDTSFEAWLEQVKSHLVSKGAVIDLAAVPFADLDYAYRSGSSPVVFAKALIAKTPQVPAAPPLPPQAIPPATQAPAAPPIPPQAVPPVSYYQPQPQPNKPIGFGQSLIIGAGATLGYLLMTSIVGLLSICVLGSCALSCARGVASGMNNGQRQAAERQSSSAQNTKAPVSKSGRE